MEHTTGPRATAKLSSHQRRSTALRNRNEEQWLERLELNRSRLSELIYRLREMSTGDERPEVIPAGGTLEDGDVRDQDLSMRDGTAETMLRLLSQNRDQVEHALHRVEQGTYGYCEDCDVPIPAERLQIRPEATRCTPCQTARDRARWASG